jgi:hypothetical protein
MRGNLLQPLIPMLPAIAPAIQGIRRTRALGDSLIAHPPPDPVESRRRRKTQRRWATIIVRTVIPNNQDSLRLIARNHVRNSTRGRLSRTRDSNRLSEIRHSQGSRLRTARNRVRNSTRGRLSRTRDSNSQNEIRRNRDSRRRIVRNRDRSRIRDQRHRSRDSSNLSSGHHRGSPHLHEMPVSLNRNLRRDSLSKNRSSKRKMKSPLKKKKRIDTIANPGY